MIDTHTHFYDITRPEHYWPSPGSDIYRTCMPEHYRALAAPLGVTGIIVVEASPQEVDNAWILSLAEKDTFLKGFVGNLPAGTPDFSRQLRRFSQHPLFLGIRIGCSQRGHLLRPEILDDLRRLSDAGLELDVLCGTAVLEDLPELHRRLPALRVVVNHIGGVRTDGTGPDAAWARAMRALKDIPEVYCKVSALVELNPHASKAAMADYLPVLDHLWSVFGADRLVYGSNWPVCERHAGYETVQSVPAQYFQAKGAEAAGKFFHDNSRRAYRWPDR
ncbi:MAG: amidohydrolase family protein [Planctomycetes bacterium]|nr:amidohydrolase family protein [Planctomycetota bacterium]